MEVVVEIRPGADNEIDEAAFHQLDRTAAKTGRCQRAGNRETNCRVVLGRQHLSGEDVAGLRKAPGVEGLKAIVDELLDFCASARPIVANGFSGKVVLRLAVARRPGRSVGHRTSTI